MIKGKKIALGIIGILLSIIIGILVTGYFYLSNFINKTTKVEIDKENIGITEEVEEKLSEYDNNIINIALFGIDADENGVGRSDSIMIATIDNQNNKIKLTSIMRDSYVDIEGRGYDKINHAYAFGGHELAINTLNKNFDLNIKDFISVNFSSLPRIIDKLGGVDIEIDEEEINYINSYIDSINKINGTNSPHISSIGVHHMDGTQALAYCRIRYTTGGDYKRTERHREVLLSIFSKLENLNVIEYPSILNDIMLIVETNLKSSNILDLGSEILKMGKPNLEQERFPRDGYCQGEMIDGVYYLTFDKATTVEQLHDYIFEYK